MDRITCPHCYERVFGFKDRWGITCEYCWGELDDMPGLESSPTVLTDLPALLPAAPKRSTQYEEGTYAYESHRERYYKRAQTSPITYPPGATGRGNGGVSA